MFPRVKCRQIDAAKTETFDDLDEAKQWMLRNCQEDRYYIGTEEGGWYHSNEALWNEVTSDGKDSKSDSEKATCDDALLGKRDGMGDRITPVTPDPPTKTVGSTAKKSRKSVLAARSREEKEMN